MFFDRIRYFNKYVLNRFMMKFVVTPRSKKFALLRHTGRKSGKIFQTPLIVVPHKDHFIIALTYGPKVDWLRNLQATGHGTIVWQGKDYEIGRPEPVETAEGLSNFATLERFILRWVNVEHFIRVPSSTPLPIVA
jgi:deazaflavin-dependent oxidoreductase (nitroreductase family)